jgi:hypothetical protein
MCVISVSTVFILRVFNFLSSGQNNKILYNILYKKWFSLYNKEKTGNSAPKLCFIRSLKIGLYNIKILLRRFNAVLTRGGSIHG